MHYGPIPKGMFVLHHCDNPPCVRPDHLFLGTAADNTADMMSKGRGSYKTHPQAGALNHNAKLHPAEVIEIRRLWSTGMTQRAIADQLGITRPAVSLIVTRKRWSHI